MKHPFDPRINAGYEKAVWHADPKLEALIVALVEQCKPDRICETGTHLGWTTHWLASRWPELPIETVELDDSYFRLAEENLQDFRYVATWHASSADFMKSRRDVFAASRLPMFWLDAHWFKPVPLRAECQIVSTLPRYIAIIDDFDLKNPDFPGDGGEETFGYKMCNLEYVAEFLGPRCWRPNYPCEPGFKGYGVFTKGVVWEPPSWMKEDVLPGAPQLAFT